VVVFWVKFQTLASRHNFRVVSRTREIAFLTQATPHEPFIMPTWDQVKKWNWPMIMRLLSIICGIGTVFTGVFSLLTSFDDFPAALIINFYLMSVLHQQI
jgi:hypothetical protein